MFLYSIKKQQKKTEITNNDPFCCCFCYCSFLFWFSNFFCLFCFLKFIFSHNSLITGGLPYLACHLPSTGWGSIHKFCIEIYIHIYTDIHHRNRHIHTYTYTHKNTPTETSHRQCTHTHIHTHTEYVRICVHLCVYVQY